MSADNVIHAKFGAERRQALALEAMTSQLVEIGRMVGDSPELMRAKAARAMTLVNEICDYRVSTAHPSLPPGLTSEQQVAVNAAFEQLYRAGAAAVAEAAIRAFLAAVAELCTSALAVTKT